MLCRRTFWSSLHGGPLGSCTATPGGGGWLLSYVRSRWPTVVGLTVCAIRPTRGPAAGVAMSVGNVSGSCPPRCHCAASRRGRLDSGWTGWLLPTQTRPSAFSKAAGRADRLPSVSTSPKQPFVATRPRPEGDSRSGRQQSFARSFEPPPSLGSISMWLAGNTHGGRV